MVNKTNEDWKGILRSINIKVNRYPFQNIPKNFNERIAIKGSGDCRSYTYEKFYRMLMRGFPNDRLSFCSCMTETDEAHSVLLVQFDKELWCADNRNEWVHDFRRTPYQWDWIPSFLMKLIE